MKINRIKKLLVSVLGCSMAFGNISYIPTMAKENVQNYGLNNPTTYSSGVSTWDCIYFGNYWQNDTNGDGVADKSDAKQTIKWRVLSVNGDDAFVVADQNLDSKAYNETKTDVTWENSTIRSWLNGYGELVNKDKKSFIIDNFLDNAFSGAEQNAIKTTYVVNEDNTDYGMLNNVGHGQLLIVHFWTMEIGGCVRRAAQLVLLQVYLATAQAATTTVL